jgi:hypothetical protein
VFFVVSAIDYIVTLKVVEDKARSAGGKGGMGRMGEMRDNIAKRQVFERTTALRNQRG